VKRREFIKKGAIGVAASTATVAVGTTLSTPALAKGRKKWIAVSAFGKAGLLGQAIGRFAKFVKTASEGHMSIKVYHAGELVKPFEAMDAVQSGTAQMGFGAPYYWAGKSDSISFVAAMPFGLTAQEQNAWCYYGGGIEMADKTAYKPLGLKFLPLGNTGNQMGGWYAKPINTVADLKGLKFRMPGLGGEILKTFGVNVVLLPGSEVLPALTSGAIDGTEWIGPAADMGKGLFKVVKNYYYPGWHEPATILDGFFDLKQWEKLDKGLKEIVIRGAAATNLFILSRFQALNNAALQKLIKEHNIKLLKYSDELITAIGKRATVVLPEVAKRSADGKALFNHIIDFRSTMVDWSGYSEASFLTARTAANFKPV
jgi:TRAP-type mannitol/chloroaromatic compound transport system substrate-binding protein